ncbi:transcriptional regulator, TetR family [Chloroherpeton thalassium ATCC 35110]|uniref:Transcriptional regulator, TetR family n=1 Tax=Chloroherpeton thalassium (strain ATCC 35110 / GB-78) TaxID=517418 RepID=B3QYU7_CHLT3|nr:TetR family transcriptional regulator [Chloroherpeton thalassium]ACF15170.1 transcriptional regulator, TetR family [Chloroherpeton thalassium ATCC 35110]
MRVTKEQAEQTKKALIDAGLDVFSEKGFASTRLEDIVKHAGLTRGAFYWHFKNKLELYCEVYKEGMKYISIRLRDAIQPENSSLNNIKRALLFIASDINTEERIGKFAKLQYTIEWTPEIREAIEYIKHEMSLPFRTLMYGLIEKGKDEGLIKKGVDTEIIFKAVVSLLIGMSNLKHEKNYPLDTEDIDPMLSIFIDGIRN